MRTVINYYANGLERRTCPRCASFSGGGGTRTLESLADDSMVVLRGEHAGGEVDRSNVKRSRSSVTPEQIQRFRRVSRTAAPAPAPPPNTSNNSDEPSSASESQASTPNESESTQDPSSAADSHTNTPLRQQTPTPAQVPPAERRRRISAIISPFGFLGADGANDAGRRSPTGVSLSPSPPYQSPFQSPSAEPMPTLPIMSVSVPVPVRPRILLEDRSISSVLNDTHGSNDLDMLEPPSAASTHSPTPLDESRSEFGSSLDISSASTSSLYARTPDPDASGCECARSSSALGLQLNGAPDGDADKVALSVEEKVFTLHDSHDTFFSTSNCLTVFLFLRLDLTLSINLQLTSTCKLTCVMWMHNNTSM